MNVTRTIASHQHSHRRRSRGSLLLVGLGLSAALLSGCSITTVDGEDAPAPAASTDAPALTSEQQEAREELRASSTATITCDGELLLGAEQSAQVIVVTGHCESLTVDAEGAAVVAESVGSLAVGGSGTVIYVDSAHSVSVMGSASVVNWASGDPTVSDTGQANVVQEG